MTGGTDAGQKIVAYYEVAERMFPILPDAVLIREDTPAGTFGLAWYYGLDPDTGRPMFAVRDDIDIPATPYIGFHEAGHAFQTIVARGIAKQQGTSLQDAFDQVRARYWQMRGFPGTWLDAQMQAINGGGWMYFPDESFADAFAHVVFGYSNGEWTWNWNGQYAIDVPRAAAFMRELQAEARGDDMDEETVRRIAGQVADEKVAAYALQARLTGFEPIKQVLAEQAAQIRAAGSEHKHQTPATQTGGPVSL